MEYSNAQARAVINEWIHSSFDRKIMEARLIDGETYEVIAERMGVDPITIKRHVAKCMPAIRKKLN